VVAERGKIVIEDDGTLWVMQGEIDGTLRDRHEGELRTLARRAERRITIDLTRVTFIDSGGLRLLYRATESPAERPVLRGAARHVLERLELAGAVSMFTVEPEGPAPGSASGAD
jgi:anti-sigma B factor antagonist